MAPSGSRAFSICGQEGACGEEESLDNSDLTVCSVVKSNSKYAGRAVNERNFKGSNLDVGIGSKLDEHILEKIFARLPFKSFFQALSLSRAWRVRYRSPSFQSEVLNSSTASSWKSYAPLFQNRKQDLVGYESSSERWHILPTHSYLEQDPIHHWSLRAGAGSLLCWTCPNANDRNVCHVRVTNPLTRSWKQLPTRPKMQIPDLVHIGWEGSKAYKVILGTFERLRVCISVQIFDSTDDSWTMENCNKGTNLREARCLGSAFIRGILYMLVKTFDATGTGFKLIFFDVKEKIWEETPLHAVIIGSQNPHRLTTVFYSMQVIVFGSNVILVAVTLNTLVVFKLDLESRLAVEVSRAPNEMLSGAILSNCKAAGQGDCLYIGGRPCFSSVILYNLRTRQWHQVNSVTDILLSVTSTPTIEWVWSSVTYQPGLNPFLEV